MSPLKWLAYWVVFGLPPLMVWRLVKLFRTPGRPRGYYLGGVLIAIGVLIWVPYMLMRRLWGMQLSVFPFLIGHLAATMSGTILKRKARKMGSQAR